MRWRALSAAALLVASGTAGAQANITFDGEAPGPLHGRTIQGVLFQYLVGGSPSSDFVVGGGPGCLTFVCDPSAEGGAAANALVRLTFAPVLSFGFGMAASTIGGVSQFFVSLFDQSNTLLGMFIVNATSLGSFNEGRFDHATPGIARADITFGTGYSRFVIDNIQTNTVVPEPATLTLLATGIAGLAGVARRRRQRSIG